MNNKIKYIDNALALQNNAQTDDGKALVCKLEKDVAWFSNNFYDTPSVDSGWGHAYFCSEDGSFLNFDRTSPNVHICPICNKKFTDPIYNAAWIYLYRYEALMSALEAATLYCINSDEKYLKHFVRIISFYSDNYSEFSEHGKGPTTSGNGKITPQALNEAIFLAKVVNGLEMLKDVLPFAFVDSVKKNLLMPGAKFINAQKKIIHNIPCWINAGVGTVGLFCNDAELIYLAFSAPLGLFDQVKQGVTESFFWYEGSIHYNFFTIESFMHLFLFAAIYNYEIPQDIQSIVYNMMLAPCKMAFSNTVLPNPNDGWPNLNLKTYSYLYESAAKIFNSDELRNILSNIYAQPIVRTPLPMSSPIYFNDICMEKLLFSSSTSFAIPLEIWHTSHCFSASDYAMLRKKNVELFIKYGHCSPSHAHPDKMNIEVSAHGTLISRDLSNCGYAARLCNEFHRTSVSHNTVVMNGETHPTTQRGECTGFNHTDASILVSCKDVYENVDFTREISLTNSGFDDIFTINSVENNTFDWFFHCEGSLCSILESQAANLDYNTNGYQHFQNVKKININGSSLKLRWQFQNNVIGIQTLSTSCLEVFICESYDNPVNKMRTTVILRANSKTNIFKQNFSFEKVN